MLIDLLDGGQPKSRPVRIDRTVDAQIALKLAKYRLRSLVMVAEHQCAHLLVSPLELLLGVVLSDEGELVRRNCGGADAPDTAHVDRS